LGICFPRHRESIPDRDPAFAPPSAQSPGSPRESQWQTLGLVRADSASQEDRMATIQHSTNGSSLAEVVDRILDRGCVIDAFVRVTLVGIELLAIEARIVIASVDTWLKYAEAVGLTTTFEQMNDMPA
jgi:hypothetical protein